MHARGGLAKELMKQVFGPRRGRMCSDARVRASLRSLVDRIVGSGFTHANFSNMRHIENVIQFMY